MASCRYFLSSRCYFLVVVVVRFGPIPVARPGGAPKPLPVPIPWCIGTAGRGPDVGWSVAPPPRKVPQHTCRLCARHSLRAVASLPRPSFTVDLGPGLNTPLRCIVERQSRSHPRSRACHPAREGMGGCGIAEWRRIRAMGRVPAGPSPLACASPFGGHPVARSSRA